MNKVEIIELMAEGGSITVFGKCEEGIWTFWNETDELIFDENDDECQIKNVSNHSETLSRALPSEFYMYTPNNVHPEFFENIKSEIKQKLNGEISLADNVMERVIRRWADFQ